MQFLLYWAHRLLDFREPELEQLLDLWHSRVGSARPGPAVSLPEGHSWLSPFRLAHFETEEQAHDICSQSLLVKAGLSAVVLEAPSQVAKCSQMRPVPGRV